MENIRYIAINYLTYLILNNRKLENKHEHAELPPIRAIYQNYHTS